MRATGSMGTSAEVGRATARGPRALLAAVLFAGVMVAPVVTASPALAAASTLFAEGATTPIGAIVDPANRVWIGDHASGFCRVTDPTEEGPGVMERDTCIGGDVPVEPGPIAVAQMSFYDPTPEEPGSGDEMVFLPEDRRPSTTVFRARWNPSTELFESAGLIDVGERPLTTAIGPDGNLYVGDARTSFIWRVIDPTADDPPAGTIVGSNHTNCCVVPAPSETLSIAVGGTAADPIVYTADADGVGRLEPVEDPGFEDHAEIIEAIPGTIQSLTIDREREVLYVGTADANFGDRGPGTDVVHRIDLSSGEITAEDVDVDWATGFSMINGLAIGEGARLMVVDDEGMTEAEAPGMGRVHLVGPPAARIVAGPTRAAGAWAPFRSITNDQTPSFEISGHPSNPGGTTLTCAVHDASDDEVVAEEDCAPGLYDVTETLPEGNYRMLVRATGPDEEVGVPTVQRFEVDVTAPAAPAITSPSPGGVTGRAPTFVFTGEAEATFDCSVDGGAYEACRSGIALEPITGVTGDHTAALRTIDRAGNISVPASIDFTVDADRPQLTITTKNKARVSRRPSFGFTSSATDLDHFECRLDSAAFEPCTSPAPYSELTGGLHSFSVRSVDAVGNQMQKQISVFVDAVGPTATTTAPSAFSPNRDRTQDTFAVRTRFSERSRGRLSIYDGSKLVWRSPKPVVGKTIDLKWNGRRSNGAVASDATYRWVVGGTDVYNNPIRGSKSGSVRVDTFSAPRRLKLKPFRVDRDGRAPITVGFRLGERSRVRITVHKSGRRIELLQAFTAPAGKVFRAWSGLVDGSYLGAGRYEMRVHTTDSVGNHGFRRTYLRISR